MRSYTIHTKKQMELAMRVFRAYGESWSAVKRAATRGDDGVWVVPAIPKTPKGDGKKKS